MITKTHIAAFLLGLAMVLYGLCSNAQEPQASLQDVVSEGQVVPPAQQASPGQQAAPNSTPTNTLSGAIEAFKSKQYPMGAASVLMLLVFLANKFIKNLPRKWVPWVAAFSGVASSVAIGIHAGMPWMDAVMDGLVLGTAAGGLWELAGKHVLPKKSYKSK